MPRKSRLDVIKEKFGGKWTFDYASKNWYCKDGREIVRIKDCSCWLFNSEKCLCPVYYEMRGDGPPHPVEIEDPAMYYLNGRDSTPKHLRKKNV